VSSFYNIIYVIEVLCDVIKLNFWPFRRVTQCLVWLCPTQTAYWVKHYVTILTRAAHWMTYY